MKGKDTSWGEVADWYSEHVDDADSYHTHVVLPHLSRAIALVSSDRVLDLACGSGFFAREWVKKAQRVVGIDVSAELIAIAQKNAQQISSTPEQSRLQYVVSSADDLHMIADQSMDKISFVLAIQNIERVKEVLAECFRVLVPGGSLYIVMNHPAFRIPKASSWSWDDTNKAQYRRVESYLSESKVSIDMHPGNKEKKETISFHRPLQYYFKLFANAGFMVARLEEWISHKKSENGPRQAAEDRARKEIPLFLYIQVQKPH